MTPGPAYTIDRSSYPIIRIQWRRDGTAQEFQGYLRDMETIVAQQRRVTLLFHMPAHLSFTTEERITVSRWLRDNEDAIGRAIVGTCFLTPSTFINMALRAIFVFAPPKSLYKITASEEEAEAWCRAAQEGKSAELAS